MLQAKPNPVNAELGLPLADAFERDMQRLFDQEADFALAMIDLDHFDRVNKEFGRDEGDRVIIETGRHIRAKTPAEHAVYRYGGDQFAVAFAPSVEKEDAFLLMEELRRSFDCKLPDGSFVTLSIGIAAAQEDAGSYLELVRKAEGAMVRGKLLGHNRVCLAREEKMVPKTTHYTAEQLKRLSKVSAKEGAGEAMLLREALDLLLKKYDA